MLTHFNAALSGIAGVQPLDHLASLAEVFLSVRGVALVDMGPPFSVLGRSAGARVLSEEALQAAGRAPLTSLPFDETATNLVKGKSLHTAAPFTHVVRLPLMADRAQTAILVFPILPGVEARRLQRVVEVSRRQLAENALLQRYRADLGRYIRMFDQLERTARIGIWEYDLEEHTIFWSDEIYRIHELTPGIRPSFDDALNFYPKAARKRLLEALSEAQETGTVCDITVPFRTATNRSLTVRVIASVQRSPADGRARMAGVFQDVTAQQEATERLWWTANHDTLTNLPNRALFADRFRKALQRRRRTGNNVVLVLVDVNKFKAVNDGLGHAAGDELLRLVARRLQDKVRVHDTVARTGGDEFSILFEDIDRHEDIDAVLKRLSDGLVVRLGWEQSTLDVHLSAGAAIAPQHGETEDELIRAADLALYRMKGEATGSLAIYRPAFGQEERERNQLLSDARIALEEGRIIPYYQPQVDIASGRIVSVEALARWDCGDKVLSAGEFGFALTDHELGAQIGRAVVDRAIAEIASLNAGRADKLALSINASAGELLRASFLERIGQLCHERATDLGPITVEITEDVILDDRGDSLFAQMHEAHANGVQFSLDDFGTGYASLIHISTLPISEVKVDRRFITDITKDKAKQKVIKGIIEVARSLNLRLIVEGVETVAQLEQIVALGGKLAQGHYYSRAVTFAQLTALVDGTPQNLAKAA
ncbi:MAG: EAL domain-containing protein [Devosia sp.]